MVEFRSKELLEELLGEPARARFCTGMAKLWTLLPTYEEKALEFAGLARRGGDLFLPSLVDPKIGDLDRAAAENGDAEEENASKPDRFIVVGGKFEGSPRFGLLKDEITGVGLTEIGGDGDDLLDENIF